MSDSYQESMVQAVQQVNPAAHANAATTSAPEEDPAMEQDAEQGEEEHPTEDVTIEDVE